MKKSTIGTNPLDFVIPSKAEIQNVSSENELQDANKDIKERITFQLPASLIDRARNAVYWSPELTMAQLAEIGIATYIDQLEKERNAPFPPRKGAIKTGRPVKMND
jgi:hypothetical protein